MTTLRKYTKELPVPLTDEEVGKRQEQLTSSALTLEKLRQEEEDIKAGHRDENKAFKQRLSTALDQQATLGHEISTRTRDANVPVEDVAMPDHDCVATIRLDTDAVIGTRSITDSERQQSLLDEDRKRSQEEIDQIADALKSFTEQMEQEQEDDDGGGTGD